MQRSSEPGLLNMWALSTAAIFSSAQRSPGGKPRPPRSLLSFSFFFSLPTRPSYRRRVSRFIAITLQLTGAHDPHTAQHLTDWKSRLKAEFYSSYKSFPDMSNPPPTRPQNPMHPLSPSHALPPSVSYTELFFVFLNLQLSSFPANECTLRRPGSFLSINPHCTSYLFLDGTLIFSFSL